MSPNFIGEEKENRGNRCRPVDLSWMLSLEEKRKSFRRGSFIDKQDIPIRSVLEDNKIIEYLRSQGFTIGLARTLIRNTDTFPARVWLVDNSSSMNAADGHRVVQTIDHKITNVSCTRWEEVTSTLLWHGNFATLMKAPTAIRLVNAPMVGHPQQIGIASTEQVDVAAELSKLQALVQQHPSGSGGQLSHLREIVNSCLDTPLELLARRSMAIIFVTDRLPVNEYGQEGEAVTQQFVEILNELKGLPVWVVIRLSTDEPRVVDFYNDLDTKMVDVSGDLSGAPPIHLDVLDDYVSEAASVNEFNPWLNYAYPLHLCRESAVNFPVFDALNDRPLNHDELVDFVNLLFDRNQQAWAQQPLPNPKTHYAEFRADVLYLVRRNGTLYNPIKKRVLPWIDVNQMDRIYGPPGASTGCSCAIL